MNVKIEKLVYGGEGLAHAEGNTVFVPFVLPGEVAGVRPVERKKRFVRASLIQIVEAAPERVTAECPHFTACGGCHYQHISYEFQIKYKADIVRETLSRLGRVKWEGEIRTHVSPPHGYRNRAQWKARSTEGEQRASTFGYNRGGSSTILNIERCPVLSPRLEEVFLSVKELALGGQLPGLREVEAFANVPGEHVLLNASFADPRTATKSICETLRGEIPQASSILVHDHSKDRYELEGPGFIHYSAARNKYRVGHLSFFQVNQFLIDEIVQAVMNGESGSFAMDLFAGVGLFALPLARAFGRVVAVESNEAAVRDLQSNAEAGGVSIEPVSQETERHLSRCKETPDLVVLDPPRAGVGTAGIADLSRIAPRRIAYLSCDPATLARDLAGLLAPSGQGSPRYELREVHLFDVFPQTYHIETLVKLERV